jgi:hypothetical protein
MLKLTMENTVIDKNQNDERLLDLAWNSKPENSPIFSCRLKLFVQALYSKMEIYARKVKKASDLR